MRKARAGGKLVELRKEPITESGWEALRGGRYADSGDCGRVFRLIADSDSDRSRTAFR